MDLGKLRRTPLYRELFEDSPLLPKNLTVPIPLKKDEAPDQILDRLLPLYDKGLRSIYLSREDDTGELNLMPQISKLLTKVKSYAPHLFTFLDLPQSIKAQEIIDNEGDSFIDALVLSRQQMIDAPSQRPNDPLFFLLIDTTDVPTRESLREMKNLDGLCFQSLPSRAHKAKQLVKEFMLPALFIHSQEYTASLRETACDAQLERVKLCHESLIALRRAGAHCIVSDLCYEQGLFDEGAMLTQ